MPFSTGQTVYSRYRIEALLGEGGMGAVYRAYDLTLNRRCAVKEMVPPSHMSPGEVAQLRQQFQQEASILANLSHSNLTRVTDRFTWMGYEVLVMDFVDGQSLDTLIDQTGGRGLDEAQVSTWARQLLEALDYCHGQGIVHRDIKPANIIITPQGQAVLVDFGLVKLWNPANPQTMTILRGLGTPAYAPPEQYSLGFGHTEACSDLYSLGATLYHALTGQEPPMATLRMASGNPLTSPRSLNPALNPKTEAVIIKAMELEKPRRFQSAKAMLAALDQPTGRPVPIPCPATIRSLPPLLLAMGALALLLLFAGALWLISQEDKKPTPTPTQNVAAGRTVPGEDTVAPHLLSATATPSVPTRSPTWTTAASSPTRVPPSPSVTMLPTTVPSTVRPSSTVTSIAEPYVGQVAAVRVPVADVWPSPRVESGQKRETQALMGEQVEITEIQGEWYRVVVLAQPSRKDSRGYPGWVQARDITLSTYLSDNFIIVMVPSAPLRALPEPGSPIVAEVSLDTRLNIIDQASPWIQVVLPDGDRAWIEEALIRVEGGRQSVYKALPEDLINTAKSLLGTPYLWGGSSWKALDCSGVVYRTFHAHGILLARDSRDQAQDGQVVAREALEPGDLVFYAVGGASGTVSHVSLYIGSGQAIATYDGQYVSTRRYDDPNYAKGFWGARRYW